MGRRPLRNPRAFSALTEALYGKPPRSPHWTSARDMMRRIEADVIPFALQLGWVRTSEAPPRPGSPSSYHYSFEQPAAGQRREMDLNFDGGDSPAIYIGCVLEPGPHGYEDYTVSVSSERYTDWPRQPYLDRLIRGPVEPPPETIETAVVNGLQRLALLQAFILTGARHPGFHVLSRRTTDDA